MCESSSKTFLMAAGAAVAWAETWRVEPNTPAAEGARHPGQVEPFHPHAMRAVDHDPPTAFRHHRHRQEAGLRRHLGRPRSPEQRGTANGQLQ